jgi:hypothetical protein
VLVLRQKKAVMGALANRYESSICQYRIQQQRQDHSEERLLIMKKERFPQPKNFKLYKCDLPAAIGVMDNMYCIIQVPTTVAEKMLPKGLHLAEQDLTPKRMHPIMFFFTHNKFRLYPKTEYRELLVGVPFVDTDRKYNGYLGTYTYMPRLYLNRYLPRILGNRLYGYEKQAAIIEDDGCGTHIVQNEIPSHNYLIMGRTERALCTHPTEWIVTERITNRIFSMELGKEADVTAGSCAMSLLILQHSQQLTTDAEWPMIVHRIGKMEADYLPVEGLEYIEETNADMKYKSEPERWFARLRASYSISESAIKTGKEQDHSVKIEL